MKLLRRIVVGTVLLGGLAIHAHCQRRAVTVPLGDAPTQYERWLAAVEQ